MAASVGILVLTFTLTLVSFTCDATTHWIVTEDGRIQSQPETFFNIKRPYDLVAMLKQEERSESLKRIGEEMLSHGEGVKREGAAKGPGLEQQFYKTDKNCVVAGKPLAEFDLYISTLLPIENKGIEIKDYISLPAPCTGPTCRMTIPPTGPDCVAMVDLEYSIHAFEHLEGMKERGKLVGSPEVGLKSAVTPSHEVDVYGGAVATALKLNTTSWVLYNMAAFYWRIKGDSRQVIECVRRALHFSPHDQKDIALINLGNVLHRAHYSNEAAIVVHAAVEISKDLNVNHFTLANIYAVLGEYNKSLICFENTLKIQPDFEVAEKRRHAILCHQKLEVILETEHRRLQKTLVDLREYQNKHDTYRQHSDKLKQEQVTSDVRMDQRVAYEESRIQRNRTYRKDLCETMTENGKRVMVSCGYTDEYLKGLFHPSQEPPETNTSTGNGETGDKPTSVKKYPKIDYDQNPPQTEDADWPTKDDCDNVDIVFKPHLQPTHYLPPSNKGFSVVSLLTTGLHLKPGDQHELPWYPPVCDPPVITKDNETTVYGHLKSLRRDKLATYTSKLPDDTLKVHVDNLVDDARVTEEEIGQRILTAIKQTESQGKWLLYTIAGLYWMLKGHSIHAIECLQNAIGLAPQTYRDVPLVNLASVLYRLNYYRDAGVITNDALAIDQNEPVTQALMGNIQLLKGNNSGAASHYKKSLRLEPEYTEATKMLLLVKCKEKFHPSQSKPDDNGTPSCAPKGDKGGTGDRKYICKMDQGEEKCIMDPPTAPTTEPEKPGCNCNNFCSKPGEKQDDEIDEIDECNNDIEQSDPYGAVEDPPEFQDKRAYCQGEDCKHIHVSQGAQKSHIKLTMLDGHLHQKIVVSNSPNDIRVENYECLIYSDGSCSVGCNRDEFKHYVASMREHVKEANLGYVPDDLHERLREDLLASVNKEAAQMAEELGSKVTVTEETLDTGETLLHVTRESIKMIIDKDSYNEHDIVDTYVMEAERDPPDTTRHLQGLSPPHLPTIEQCKKTKTVNFLHFTSTWLAVSAKGVNVHDFLDFDSEIAEFYREPICHPPSVFEGDITEYPGLVYPQALGYRAEEGLKKMLRYVSGTLHPIPMTAMIIAMALEKNVTSWVLASIATLYWRSEGNVKEAVECIKLGLHYAPHDKKDVALISLANILFRSGRFNDAIVVMDKALDFSPTPVVSHFTLANIYAAKLEWDQAIMFYHAALQRRPKFKPAQQRLTLIQCVKKMHFGG